MKQKFPGPFHLHMDPFESFDGVTGRADIVQAEPWLDEPVHLVG